MKYVDLQTAQDLKALGYDGEYAHFWKFFEGWGYHAPVKSDHVYYESDYPAPRLDDAAYFLRDRYQTDILVLRDWMAGDWDCGYEDGNGERHIGSGRTYEDALQAALSHVARMLRDKMEMESRATRNRFEP